MKPCDSTVLVPSHVSVLRWKVDKGSSLKDMDVDMKEKLGTQVIPEAFVGYRYQPADGGFFFRIGVGWPHAPPGINTSLGYTF